MGISRAKLRAEPDQEETMYIHLIRTAQCPVCTVRVIGPLLDVLIPLVPGPCYSRYSITPLVSFD